MLDADGVTILTDDTELSGFGLTLTGGGRGFAPMTPVVDGPSGIRVSRQPPAGTNYLR